MTEPIKKIDSQKFMEFVLKFLYNQRYLKYQYLTNGREMSFEEFMEAYSLYEEE